MKVLTLFFVAFFMHFATSPTFAAFPVKYTIATNSVNSGTTIDRSTFIPKKKHDHINGTTSLVLGIIGLIPVLGVFLGLPAVIFGVVGISKKEKYAVAGLILGVIGMAIGVVVMLFALGLLI